MNAKKKDKPFEKFTLRILKKRYMPLKLFEFHEQFMFDPYIVQINLIWKNWSNKQNFHSAG